MGDDPGGFHGGHRRRDAGGCPRVSGAGGAAHSGGPRSADGDPPGGTGRGGGVTEGT